MDIFKGKVVIPKVEYEKDVHLNVQETYRNKETWND